MFEKLKGKLKSWFKSSEEKVEEKIAEAKEEKQIEKKPKKPKTKPEKIKKERTSEDIKQERQVSEKVIEDIKQEGLEIKSPEEKFAELQQEKEELIKQAEIKIEEKPEEKKGLLSRLFGRKKVEEEEQEPGIKTKEEKPEEKKGFFKRVISKFRFKITEEYFSSIFSELELVLLENNVAFEVVEEIKKSLKTELLGKEMPKEKVQGEITRALKNSINSLIKEPYNLIEKINEKLKEKNEPFVIVFFGINGSGKTTSIAKLAYMLKSKGLSVVLAASDTFRAASIEQLSQHSEKLGVKIIKSQYNADPSSVAFDAIKHAKAQGIKVVLIDTAGRMHAKESLMKEMEKIVRVTKPDLKIFIGESTTGNDAVEQARVFSESIGIDGIILSKADVDEKGGTILSVSYVTGKPILYLGTGQNYEDLELFDKAKVLEKMGL